MEETTILEAVNRLRADPKGFVGSLRGDPPEDDLVDDENPIGKDEHIDNELEEGDTDGNADDSFEDVAAAEPLLASPSLSVLAAECCRALAQDKMEDVGLQDYLRDVCMSAGYQLGADCHPLGILLPATPTGDLIQAWLSSLPPEDRMHIVSEQLLNPRFKELGAAVISSTDNILAVIILANGSLPVEGTEEEETTTTPAELASAPAIGWSDVVEASKPASLRVPKRMHESVKKLSRPKITADVEAVSSSTEAAKLGIATPGLGPQGYILNRVVRAFVSQCDTNDDGRVTASDIICMAKTNGSHRPKALALVIANMEDMIADIVSKRRNHPVRTTAAEALSSSVTWSEVATAMRERKEWTRLDEDKEHAAKKIDNLNKHWVYQRDKYAGLWVLTLSLCGFKAFVPIGCPTGARQEGSRKCQSHRCSDGGVVVKEDAPSLSPQYSNPETSVRENFCQHEGVDVGSRGELGGSRCGDSVSDNMTSQDRVRYTFEAVREFNDRYGMIQRRSNNARFHDEGSRPMLVAGRPPLGGTTGRTQLTHFHNSCSVPPRRESTDQHPPCSRAYYGVAAFKLDSGPYDDKKAWRSVGEDLRPDDRLSTMTCTDRRATWDTVTLPRRAQRQYEDRCRDHICGRAAFLGPYGASSSDSCSRVDSPARRGPHGPRLYNSQVRPQPLAPAVSQIDTLPAEATMRQQERQYDRESRHAGLGPGFKPYMPKAMGPPTKYHNMATRDLGVDTIIHDNPPVEADPASESEPFRTFARPLDASDMDRRIPVGPLPCCQTLQRRVVRSSSSTMLSCVK